MYVYGFYFVNTMNPLPTQHTIENHLLKICVILMEECDIFLRFHKHMFLPIQATCHMKQMLAVINMYMVHMLGKFVL